MATQAQVRGPAVDEAEAALRRTRAGWLRKYSSFALGSLGVLVVLVAWQLAAVTGIVDLRISSTPIEVASSLIQLFGSGQIWAPIGTTATEFGSAVAIIVVFGIPIGIILGRLTVLRKMSDPIISVLNSVPYVLFLPIIIFWFGLGEVSRVLVVVWAGILPLIINTSAGVRNIDQDYLRVGQVFCVPRVRFFWSILFPAAMPFIVAGLRLAIARALVGAIVVEFFLSSNGLGFFVQNAASQFDMSTAMAGIVVMAAAALGLSRLIGAIEHRVMSWSHAQ